MIIDQLLKAFAPPIVPNTFNGTQWADMTFVERVTSYDWTKELIVLALILVYVGLHYAGVQANKNKVDKWMKQHKPVLDQQFAQVGVKMPNADLVVSDSPTIFTTYASGRLNITGLLGRFKLMGRQNFVTLIMEYVFSLFFESFSVRDSIDLIITPSGDAKIDPFVFAIVNKADMKMAREDNYYLSLTRTVDSDKLPAYLTFMTESAEVTDSLFTAEVKEAIEDSQSVLEFLAITDQEITRPKTVEEAAPRTVVRLALKFPRNEKEAETSRKILTAAINMVDFAVSKAHWRAEVTRKIRTTREAEIKKVQKQLDEKKAEELALKKAEAKREERDKMSKLSTAEQRKIEQKEREKEQRRKMNKQTKRGAVRA